MCVLTLKIYIGRQAGRDRNFLERFMGIMIVKRNLWEYSKVNFDNNNNKLLDQNEKQ